MTFILNEAARQFFSFVFRCERVRINNSTLASDSPWGHEWNFVNNANHLHCDVDPAQWGAAAPSDGENIQPNSHRGVHTRVPAPALSRRAIHHHDEALGSEQSQSVLHQCDSGRGRAEGPPVPLLPGPGTQHAATRSHTSRCHSITPEPAEQEKRARPVRADEATQTPPLCSEWQNKTLTPVRFRGPWSPCVAQWEHGRQLNRVQIREQSGENKNWTIFLLTASAAGAKKVLFLIFEVSRMLPGLVMGRSFWN